MAALGPGACLPGGKMGRTVLVRGLPPSARAADLEREFGQAGPVRRAVAVTAPGERGGGKGRAGGGFLRVRRLTGRAGRCRRRGVHRTGLRQLLPAGGRAAGLARDPRLRRPPGQPGAGAAQEAEGGRRRRRRR
uniref:RRM domain-containing protein n=1 Tax=Naja naja TaxID=35670 RepID=A0A8C6YJB0_NAJNA